MAGRNLHTISDYISERNEGTSEKSVKNNVTSDNEKSNEGMNKSFKVQAYRDYNVCSDVENVFNLNPVNYIDHVKALQNETVVSKTSNIKEFQKTPTNSLINNINNFQPPSISTVIRTAAHIIGPVAFSKQELPVKRRQRRDDSDRNYYESLALNDDVIDLFRDHKIGNNRSVSKKEFILFIADDFLSS